MQFHKQLQLVGEAHEEEVAKLHHKHAEELWTVQEETRNLREQVLFLEALLPKEHRGRVAPLHIRGNNTSGAQWPEQGDEVVWAEDWAGIEIDTGNAPLGKQDLMQPCLELIFEKGSLSTSDVQVETKMEAYIQRPSSNVAREIFERQRSSLSACCNSHDSSGFQDYIHNRSRAVENWLSLWLLIQVGATRLHPAWHNSKSRLKAMLGDGEEEDSEQSFELRRSDFSSIVISSGMTNSKNAPRLARITQHLSSLSNTQRSTRKHNLWIMAPSSRKKICWDLCSLLWCANDFILFPLQFLESANFGSFEDTRTLVASIFWTIDIIVSLSTGYYTEDASVEMRRKNITIRYIKSWFFFDIAVLLPDWIAVFFSTHNFNTRLSIIRVIRVLRLVRLMRAVRLLPKLWENIGQQDSERFVTVARLLQHIVVMILINHYVACFLLATWIEVDSEDNFFHKYLQGLHWALAHSTLGNTDINPSTVFQRLWTCLMLMASMILFSYFLSSITNAVMHLGSLNEERRNKETRVRQFFRTNQVTRKVACQIWSYLWRKDNDLGSKTKLNEVKLFKELPNRMRTELYYQIFLPYLLVHPLFSTYNDIEPEALVMLCSRGIEQAYLHPAAEMPLETGNTLNHMIFVNSGSLLYQPYQLGSEVVVVGCYMWLCEEALWAFNAKIKGMISAGHRGSDVMKILPKEFRAMASNYSTSMPFLVSYAQTFTRSFNEACAGYDDMADGDRDLLFNDSFMIQGFVRSAGWERGRFSINTKRNIATQFYKK